MREITWGERVGLEGQQEQNPDYLGLKSERWKNGSSIYRLLVSGRFVLKEKRKNAVAKVRQGSMGVAQGWNGKNNHREQN